MSVFDLQSFIKEPSLDKFDKCRKDDLLKIADQYRISVVKQALKKTIKSVILQKLVELHVLVLPDADDAEAGLSAAADARLKSRYAGEGAEQGRRGGGAGRCQGCLAALLSLFSLFQWVWRRCAA